MQVGLLQTADLGTKLELFNLELALCILHLADMEHKRMRKEDYGVVLFPSVSHCIRAESLVQAAGLTCKLIPVPRELSSDCGTALRFSWKERDRIAAVLEEAGLEHEGIHSLP